MMPLVRGCKIPIIMVLRAFRPGCIDLATIKALPFLCIAEKIICAGDFLELFFG